jgi:hypothetical protein
MISSFKGREIKKLSMFRFRIFKVFKKGIIKTVLLLEKMSLMDRLIL